MSEINTIDEIEQSNAQFQNILSFQKWKEQRYNEVDMDCDFMIDSEIARDILQSIAPDKLDVNAAGYLLVNDMYDACLVGIDGDNRGLFTVDLPKEIADYKGDEVNMREALNLYADKASRYKHLRVIATVIVCVSMIMLAGLSIFLIKNVYVACALVIAALAYLAILVKID